MLFPRGKLSQNDLSPAYVGSAAKGTTAAQFAEEMAQERLARMQPVWRSRLADLKLRSKASAAAASAPNKCMSTPDQRVSTSPMKQ